VFKNLNMPIKQKTVENLTHLLESKPHLQNALEASIQDAQQQDIKTLEDFYDFLEKILKHIPTEKELMPSVRKFYFIISKSPNDILRKDDSFNEWINEFVVSRGDFMDTLESTETLGTFINNPEYKIDDYIKGPSGWLSYNQFLARQLKPGKRPIEGRCDDNIIVSPADSEYKGQRSITDDSTIIVKDVTYSITDLLADSAYKEYFKGGIFTHSFLSVADYHRFHMPVGGVILEVKKIAAKTWVNEIKKADGSLENIDDVGFQFTHTRAFIVIESSIGFVIVMPVGMGHISSVNITVDEGTILVKGDEFGYFAFGGSDIIMLFQPGKVSFTAKEEQHYKQGEKIATATNYNGRLHN
jgi:phosphatidylserine decarboxylase precursor